MGKNILILVIKNYQDYLKFDKEYGINMTYEFEKTSMYSNNNYNGLPNTYTRRYIDWRKVSKRYSGIEVKNYNPELPNPNPVGIQVNILT